MQKIIFKENKAYSKAYILSKLKDNTIIDKLKEKEILVLQKDGFKFKFVGVCIVDDTIIFINPKYSIADSEDKIVLNLLMEYSARETLTVEEQQYLSYDYENENNLLGIINYILKDYIENGLYLNTQKRLNINGQGRINWNKTIERNSMFLNQRKQPIYTELITWQNNINDNFIITNIHKFIINKCFEKLNKLGLMDIFNYEPMEFEVTELYDKEFMLNVLNKELNIQFQDRKINILKSMISFLNKLGGNSKDEPITLFGTKYFHVVWEKVNSYMFSNEYTKLSKYIEVPKWKTLNGNWINSTNQIKPDILKNHNKTLMILDAKYYNIKLKDDLLEGNPGSYDVIKQFTYQLAFENIKENNIFDNIINMFIYPKEINKDYEVFGFVKLEIFTSKLILNVGMNPKVVFKRYINNKKFSNDELDNFLIMYNNMLKHL